MPVEKKTYVREGYKKHQQVWRVELRNRIGSALHCPSISCTEPSVPCLSWILTKNGKRVTWIRKNKKTEMYLPRALKFGDRRAVKATQDLIQRVIVSPLFQGLRS